MSSPLRLLHISADYPDPFDDRKTPVVARLVELLDDRFQSDVISLNRVSPIGLEWLTEFSGRAELKMQRQSTAFGEAVQYRALPLGGHHARTLRLLGQNLARIVAERGWRPDLLVAYKLTIEGVATMVAAKTLGIPYAVCIQGNTDARIASVRPDLRAVFAAVMKGARAVFSFAPWSASAIERLLRCRHADMAVIPCPLDSDAMRAPTLGPKGFVTAFHLHNYRLKNLPGLAAALRLAEQDGNAHEVAVVGGGLPRDVQAVERIAATCPSLTIEGERSRPDLAERMNASAGLVLPSLRESFGLVFMESLFAGAPVIYPAGQAIDGHFGRQPFAIGVDARDPRAIAGAIQNLADRNDTAKSALAAWQASPDAERFRRAAIAGQFADLIMRAAGPRGPRAASVVR